MSIRETGLMVEPTAGLLKSVVGDTETGDSDKYRMTGHQHSYPYPPHTLSPNG